MAKYSNNKALHIGINYEGTSHELYGCINDTETMANLTKEYVLSKRRLFLTDKTKYKPNKQVIDRAFKWLRCQKCDNTGFITCNHNFPHKSGTTLYFTYSGHGSQLPDSNSDEKDGIDETIYVLDGNITDDYIFSNLIYPVPAGVRLWAVMDNCMSCTSLDLQFSIEDINDNKFTLVDNNDNFCNGEIIMVSGCLDTESSADTFVNGKFQGALTAGINDILSKNPKTRVVEMFCKLREYMTVNGYSQRPAISFGGNLNLTPFFLQPL